jgi:Flp pilus assembly protein TadG
MSARLGSSRGQALILMLLLTVVLAAGGAFAVDLGVAYAYKQRCEIAVDAAALAAASLLPDVSAAQAAGEAVALANGIDPAVLQFASPVDGDSRRISVTFAGQQPSFFARALGIEVFPVAARAVAVRGGPQVFDYALFSGSSTTRLDLSGLTVDVQGSTHSNHDTRIRGATVGVSGSLESSRQYDMRGATVQAGSIVEWAPLVPMPQYDVNELRAMCGIRYTGNQHWSGQTINVDGGVFVDGNLKLSGVTIRGQGLLVVNGNIELAGVSFAYHGSTDRVCLYSLANIKVTGTSFRADGIIYAPNGEFESHGATLQVNGSIIADTIDLSGVTLGINHDASAGSVFPGGATRLSR